MARIIEEKALATSQTSFWNDDNMIAKISFHLLYLDGILLILVQLILLQIFWKYWFTFVHNRRRFISIVGTSNLNIVDDPCTHLHFRQFHVKFGYFEKDTNLKKIFHLKFDVTELCQIVEDFFKFCGLLRISEL